MRSFVNLICTLASLTLFAIGLTDVYTLPSLDVSENLLIAYTLRGSFMMLFGVFGLLLQVYCLNMKKRIY